MKDDIYRLCEYMQPVWNYTGFEGTRQECMTKIEQLQQSTPTGIYKIFRKHPDPNAVDAETLLPPELREAWRDRMKELTDADNWNS